MTVIYFEDQASLDDLQGRSLAVLGYGMVGQPAALNLRESGLTGLIVGAEAEVEERARADGFEVMSIGEATRNASILIVTLPDETLTPVYMAQISPNLKRGDVLIFTSAYNTAFGYIEAPPFVDVGLVAPRTLNGAPRSRYTSDGGSYASFVAVGQDASGAAWPVVLGVALALGALSGGGVEVSMEQEAELSLFMQQAILPAFHNLIHTTANLLTRLGYPPEAVFQDLTIGGRFPDFMRQVALHGVQQTVERMSHDDQYSLLSRQDRFNEIKLERLMEITLEDIRNGDFAQEWANENADGQRRLQRLRRQFNALDLWEIERQTLEEINDVP